MPSWNTKKRVDFYASEEGQKIAQALEVMAKDSSYNTKSTYSANAERYPEHRVPFVDKHMDYLNSHPQINPNHYISNLRLKSKQR